MTILLCSSVTNCRDAYYYLEHQQIFFLNIQTNKYYSFNVLYYIKTNAQIMECPIHYLSVNLACSILLQLYVAPYYQLFMVGNKYACFIGTPVFTMFLFYFFLRTFLLSYTVFLCISLSLSLSLISMEM